MARLSKYQKQFCEAVQALGRGELVEGKRHLILDAKAGSGKTFTITYAMKFIPVNQRVVAVMFAKKNADDIQPKLPQTGNCVGMTTNSLGNRVLKMAGGFNRLNDNKTFDILNDMQLSFAERMLKGPILKMVGIAKSMGIVPNGVQGATGLTPDTAETWAGILEHFAIDFEQKWQEEAAIEYTRKALRLSIEMRGKANCIDYNDQLYMPVVMGLNFPKYDWVFVDEAQDINPVQRELVKRSLAPNGHLVAVGDPRQAIYGFRGADSKSMAKIKEEMDAHEMPLSICYRCDKSIVQEAKKVVAGIEWQDNRPEGIVDQGIGPEKWAAFNAIQTDDGPKFPAILCPFNAPLVATAFKLIRQKIACRVLGREIGQGLVKLLEKLQAANVKDAERLLDDYLAAEVERLADKESKIQALYDKVDTLRVFLEETPPNEPVATVTAAINALFTEEQKGADGKVQRLPMITLSTVHKAKGGEWPRVFLMCSGVLRSTVTGRAGKTRQLLPWEVEQRHNLLYVGITRAQHHLTYLEPEQLEML